MQETLIWSNNKAAYCFDFVIREISPNSMDWEIVKEPSLLAMDYDALYRQFYTLSRG